MFNWPEPIRDMAGAIASAFNNEPQKIYGLKNAGLNRAHRQRLTSLARKGDVTPADIPFWLALKFYAGMINA